MNKALTIMIIIVIIIISLAFAFQYNSKKEETNEDPNKINYNQTASQEVANCNQNSDCIIKSNGVNCPRAYNVNNLSEPELLIPPSHTECLDAEDLLAYCLNNQCISKMDCSKCDSLNTKYKETCQNYQGGTSDWICNMYNECNC